METGGHNRDFSLKINKPNLHSNSFLIRAKEFKNIK